MPEDNDTHFIHFIKTYLLWIGIGFAFNQCTFGSNELWEF